MDTNDFKKLIGSECLVIDPRSKKKIFEPATINSANFSVKKFRHTDEFYEHISYNVTLKKETISKRNKFRTKEYHRSFDVSCDRIQIRS